MATDRRAVIRLAAVNLALAGIALLGWVALALLVYFEQMPPDWPEKLRQVPDLVVLVVLLCGPACLVAGLGLLKRRRWARVLAMSLGGISGVLATAGIALVYLGVLRVSGTADLALPVLFAAYSGSVFVTMWKETSAADIS